MICSCGFKFAGPGEERNYKYYFDKNLVAYAVCPKCNTKHKWQKVKKELVQIKGLDE